MQQQPQLPYQPLTFIKTGTIGGTSKHQSQSTIYSNKHKHILIPSYLNSPFPHFYLLFHTPSIYNWLRNIPTARQAQLLHQYISQNNNKKEQQQQQHQHQHQHQHQYQHQHQQQQNNKKIMMQVDVATIVEGVNNYVNRWEAVKMAFAVKVYVNQVREHGSSACTHLAKTQQNTVLLSYNHTQKTLQCYHLNCKICKRTVQVASTIRQIPPNFLSTYSTHTITHNNIKYEASVVFTKNKIYIKAANKVWYAVDLIDGKTRNTGNVQYRQAVLLCYSVTQEIEGVLEKATPIQEVEKVLNMQRMPPSKIKQPEEEDNRQTINRQAQQKQSKHLKQQQPVSFVPQPMPHKIKPLSRPTNPILLPSSSSTSTYIQQVNAHFIQPKQKDEYELDYDKGKLKKVKEKIEYVRPDFNVVQEQVKNGAIQQHSKKIRKQQRKNKRMKKYGKERDDGFGDQ